MDFKINNVFSVVKGDRTYSINIPNGAPFGESMDFCFEVLARLAAMQKEVIDGLQTKPVEPVVDPTVES